MPTSQILNGAAGATDADADTDRLSYQQQFQQRWSWLRDPHVRALAWLIEAPNLLNAQAACWTGRIASCDTLTEEDLRWFHALDSDPEPLHAAIREHASPRLGRYAEKLLTFYLEQSGRLVAHNVQVRHRREGDPGKGTVDTIGEFDFLLHDSAPGALPDTAIHWEFATKFYLLQSQREQILVDAFVGPNLADSLGAKMHKIMQQQLMLSQHPAAADYISQTITRAQALVKGWLFYHDPVQQPQSLPAAMGIAQDHCRGFWCELSDLDLAQAEHYLILPRLSWLAPARAELAQSLSASQLQQAITASFEHILAPVMIAVCDRSGEVVVERERGFIVPDHWRDQAAQRVQQAIVRY